MAYDRPIDGRLLTFLAVLTTGVAVATGGSAAMAAKEPLTGTWSGTLEQDLSLIDEPYMTKIVFAAYQGRLTSIVGTVRMECPGPAVRDVRVLESWRLGKGPQLSQSGGFSVKADGAAISGALGKAAASGRASAIAGGCHGNGTWNAKRRL
jgi:hypothetical protein